MKIRCIYSSVEDESLDEEILKYICKISGIGVFCSGGRIVNKSKPDLEMKEIQSYILKDIDRFLPKGKNNIENCSVLCVRLNKRHSFKSYYRIVGLKTSEVELVHRIMRMYSLRVFI